MKKLQAIRDLVIIITCVIVIDTCRMYNYYAEHTEIFEQMTAEYQTVMMSK